MMSNQIFQSELDFISPTELFLTKDSIFPAKCKTVWLLSSARYQECVSQFIEKTSFPSINSVADLESLKSSVRNYIDENNEQRVEREMEILAWGISCLQLFVVNNWTGPPMSNLDTLFPNVDLKKNNDEILKFLEVDGESVYALIETPVLLYIAKTVFQQFELFEHCKTVIWWCLRYITVHQQLLRERSPSLHTLSKSVIESLTDNTFFNDVKHRSLEIQLHLEIGLLQLHYYQYKDAETHFLAANTLAGVTCSLDGALGVRTRFQQKALPQLRVRIKKENQDALISRTPIISTADIPKALLHNDDTVLETVKFSNDEEESKNLILLTSEEQALILMKCTNMHMTSASHKLKDEEIVCIIEYLLTDPKSWCVHTEALRVRSNLQRHRPRTVERSMMQLESAVKNISTKSKELVDNDLHKTHAIRLSLFYSVWPKPRWILQKQLAKLFESLGALSSALDIYRRMHMWEETVLCLIRTERGGEAEQIIREQLEIKESSNLYCLLGDILMDPEIYRKAWNISKHQNARAMRSLGAYYISKKMYKESIECFDKSLSINYLQVGAWFSMGCAALADKNFEKAAKAFQKCVSLNWDNFEAWTNLSTAFIQFNKNDQAYRALQEALKCNFDRWELWENFLFVSADTGHFQDLINAYNRLLDLKDKYVELSVLKVLVRAVTEDILDAYENPASRLRPKALELFGRLTSKITSNWNVWYLYAKLVGIGSSSANVEDSNKALFYLQKAFRSALQRPSWEKDENSAEQTAKLTMEFIDACLECQQSKSMNDNEMKSMFPAIRLSINGVVAKLRMQGDSLLNKISTKQFADLASEVESKLECFDELLAAI